TSVAALTLQTSTVAVLAAFVGLLPLSALLVALGREGRLTLTGLLPRALRRIGTLALLLGLALLAEVVAGGLLLMLAGGVSRFGWSEPRADILRAVITLVALVIVVAIGVVHDLARAAAVHRDAGLYASVSMALQTARHRSGAAALAYAWRGALTL